MTIEQKKEEVTYEKRTKNSTKFKELLEEIWSHSNTYRYWEHGQQIGDIESNLEKVTTKETNTGRYSNRKQKDNLTELPEG